MTAGPCVSLPRVKLISRVDGATHLGGPRRSLTGLLPEKFVSQRYIRRGCYGWQIEYDHV